MIETVRTSAAAREQLITLKRRTGLQHWNEICRWALCRSLAEPTVPADIDFSVDDGVEMSWSTFAGKQGPTYLALVHNRCATDGLSSDAATVARQFRLHLHRGIGYLVGDPQVKDVQGLLALVDR